MFDEFMPALRKANDEINCFGLRNVDEEAAKKTYEDLIAAQMVIYQKLIKPYAELINVLEEKERQRLT